MMVYLIGVKTAIYKITIGGIIAFCISSCTSGLTQNLSSTEPEIWTVPSMIRIGRSDRPGNKTSIKLYAARGEYESFQIGIRPSQKDLTNVNVTVSDLSNSNNQTIAKTNLTLYLEHYIKIQNSSPKPREGTNLPLKPGWYPDALIPFIDPTTQKDITNAPLDAVPFNLKKGSNQPIWVDILVPRNAESGQYQGTFTVTSNQGETSGEIVLTVWDFELPLKPSLHSAFALWEEESKSAQIELLKHKLMSGRVNHTDERELIAQWGLNSLRLPFWSGANRNTCSLKPAPSVEKLQEAATKHESELFLYIRYADEIDQCPNLIEPIKQWANNIHQAGISTAIAMTPTPELYDDGAGDGRSAVDIWIVLPKMYQRASNRVSEVLQKGDQVWFYNALVQDDYSPKWQIDFEPINFRLPHGWINQSLGLTGVLYWRVDLWTDDPFNDVQTYAQKEKNKYYPGEGMLVYPGEQVAIAGIIPSMRLKWIRDGVEDYEYIEILKKLGYEKLALEITRKVGTDWKNWTRDTNILEANRRKLGHEIEKIGRYK